MNRDLTKAYKAGGAIPAYSLVKVGAADGEVLAATAVSDLIIGVTTSIAAASGDIVDVVHEGVVDVKAGGVIARGTFVTTDGSSQGVAAAPAAGTNNSVIGRALMTAASGDIIPVLLSIGQIQG